MIQWYTWSEYHRSRHHLTVEESPQKNQLFQFDGNLWRSRHRLTTRSSDSKRIYVFLRREAWAWKQTIEGMLTTCLLWFVTPQQLTLFLQLSVKLIHLLLHYQSHVDTRYKRSLLITMLNRANRCLRHLIFFLKNAETWKQFFPKLKYPERLIDSTISRFNRSLALDKEYSDEW